MRGLLTTWRSPAFCSKQNLFQMQKEDNDFFPPQLLIYLWLCRVCTALVAPRHVKSSWTRNRTRVPCIGRWILNLWTPREVLSPAFDKCVWHSYCWETCSLHRWMGDHLGVDQEATCPLVESLQPFFSFAIGACFSLLYEEVGPANPVMSS